MFNVMIVDDEPFVRLAIKSLTVWEDEGFLFKYEASNGKEALDIYEKENDVDIFIVDMNMPVMTGLDFIENLRINDENVPVIVLSAYNDYNFVRKAFKLGIIDYILKIEMNSEKILSMLKEASERIKIRNEATTNYFKFENDIAVKELFLRDLLSNSFRNNITEKVLKESGVKLYSDNIRIAFLWIDDFYEIKRKYLDNSLEIFIKSIKTTIEQVIHRRKCGEVILLSPEEYIIFISFKNPGSDKKRVIEFLNDIKHSLKNYLNIEASIGVSTNTVDYTNINSLFKEAEKSARHRCIAGKNKIIFYNDILKSISKNDEDLDFDIKKLKNYLADRDYDSAKTEFISLVNSIKKLKLDSMDRIYDKSLRLVFILINYLNEIDVDVEVIFEIPVSFHEEIVKLATFEEFEEWLQKISDRIFMFLFEKKKERYSKSIEKAIKYIDRNFHDKDFDLNQVCSYVELSASHLSRLFSKETGSSYSEYLTKVRIDEAKKLLKDTNLKVYEICYKVGYDNVEHFSRMFKKVTGCSPNSYSNI